MTDAPARFERATPESAGVDPRALARLVRGLADTAELHSLMVVRHGRVIAEGWAPPFSADRPHLLYSLSKSFTSTAVGFAVDEGLLRLDDRVVDLVERARPGVVEAAVAGLSDDEAARVRRQRVRDLLTMTSGHDAEPDVSTNDDWLAAFVAAPLAHEPGEHFVYNTMATYVLGELLQRATGSSLLEYLEPRLLKPLGIVGATSERSPSGFDTAGFGMSARTEDLAAFGELYLRDGVWVGERVLPAGWAAAATARHVPNGSGGPDDATNDWAQGYGFQFWRSRHGYRGDGAFGQYCLVLPEHDVVVVVTSAAADMGATLNAVWDALLPGLSSDPLPVDDEGRADLAAAFASLGYPAPRGQARSAAGDALAGRRITLRPSGPPRNDARPPEPLPHALTFTPGDESDDVTLEFDEGAATFRVDHGEPREQRLIEWRGHAVPADALVSGLWSAPDTYVVTVRYPGGPHVLTVEAVVDGDAVRIDASYNLVFGDRRLPGLVGAAVR